MAYVGLPALPVFQQKYRGIMGNGKTLGCATLKHGPVFLFESRKAVTDKGRANTSARAHPPVPRFPGELQADTESLSVHKGETAEIGPGRLNGGKTLHIAAGPPRIVFQNDSLAFGCDRAFSRKPVHRDDGEKAVPLQYRCQYRQQSLRIEVDEALSGGRGVERIGGEGHIFGGTCLKIDIHPSLDRQAPRRLDLRFRNVNPREMRAAMIHVSGNDAGPGPEVQYLLAANADAQGREAFVERGWIDVPVFRVISGRPAPVEAATVVDIRVSHRQSLRRFFTAPQAFPAVLGDVLFNLSTSGLSPLLRREFGVTVLLDAELIAYAQNAPRYCQAHMPTKRFNTVPEHSPVSAAGRQ